MNVLEIDGLNVSFNVGDAELNIIRDLNFSLKQNDSISMIGESGSGKSVIAAAILNGLEKNAIVSGTVRYRGESIYDMSGKRLREVKGKGICLIPQNASQSWDPLMRIGAQMGGFLLKAGYEKKEIPSMIYDELLKCGFDDPAAITSSYPHKLSGGMSQRALIAMCTSVSPDILIADEPTKGLDGQSMSRVLELMASMKDEKTFIMITHDLCAAECCKKTAVLYAGKIVEFGDSKKVLDDPLHPYSVGLRAAHPRNGMTPIRGNGYRNPQDGCPFRERCDLCTAECSSEIPTTEVRGRMVRCIHV